MPQRNINFTALLIGCAYCCLAQAVHALPSDQDKPIKIIADSAVLNRATGIQTFTGHVNVDQGSTHLKGNKVLVYNDKKKQVKKIVAIGDENHLAHYQTVPNVKDEPFDAWAITIQYLPPQHLAHLIRHASAKQEPNTFHGPLLDYQMDQGIVTAPATTNGHVSIIMNPKHKTHLG